MNEVHIRLDPDRLRLVWPAIKIGLGGDPVVRAVLEPSEVVDVLDGSIIVLRVPVGTVRLLTDGQATRVREALANLLGDGTRLRIVDDAHPYARPTEDADGA